MGATDDRPRILFLCTGNSCRSQMAEGWARHLRPGRLEPFSAGTDPGTLDARAVRAMAEAGVDIAGQRAKHVDELAGIRFDWVVTVCGHADEHCPVFPGATRVVHQGFDDPPRLAEGAADEEAALAHYRRVRDEIGRFVASLPAALAELPRGGRSAGGEDPGPQEILDTVREGYARIAAGEAGSCCGPAACCGAGASEGPSAVARALGYDPRELADLPEGADMGLSCGNPVAVAALREGETLLDLGSGGGLDVFVAGPRLGASGRAIGVDMTPEMLRKARAGVASYRARTGLDNVEFRLGEIEHLPVADASVDVVVSNCVLNLSPDKAQAWREIARVLRPGGRVAVSDMALRRPLPDALRQGAEALVGCIAGAITVAETARLVAAAGLGDVELIEQDAHLDAMVAGNDPLQRELAAALPAGARLGDYVTSLEVRAVKP